MTNINQRLRVGLMIPANNTTMEVELPHWLGCGPCDVIRIPRPPGLLTTSDIPAYVDSAIALAQRFVTHRVDVVVYGCTAAGILAGRERDASIGQALAARTGAPTVTTAGSMVRWLEEQELQRIALVTPYSDAVNKQMIRLLHDAGIEVRNLVRFDVANVDELGAITADQVEEKARASMRDDCEGMFIACSQLPTATLIEPLAQTFGRPVASSIHVTAHYTALAAAPFATEKTGVPQ
jgi:maleate cis-trans isomerase